MRSSKPAQGVPPQRNATQGQRQKPREDIAMKKGEGDKDNKNTKDLSPELHRAIAAVDIKAVTALVEEQGHVVQRACNATGCTGRPNHPYRERLPHPKAEPIPNSNAKSTPNPNPNT